MPYDIEGARNAGLSDAEINDYLASKYKYNLAGAREAGVPDTEILNHLVKKANTPKVEEPKKEAPKTEGKPSLLAGTTLPPDIGPMGNREITEVGTVPIPALNELPKLDASKMPVEGAATPTGDTSFFEQLVQKGVPSGVIGLKSMKTGVGMQADASAITAATKSLETYKAIDEGRITTPAEASQAGMSAQAAKAYLSAKTPEAKEQVKQNQQDIIGKRQDLIKEAVGLFKQYQAEAEKVKGATPDITDVNTVKDFTNWLGYNFGSGAVQLAPVMVAALTTGGWGAFGLSTAMGTGEAVNNRMQFIQDKIKDLPPEQQADAIQKYIQDTGDTNLAIGLASGFMDMAGPVGSILRARAGKEGIKALTKKEAAIAAVKEAPRAIGEEALTGAGQEITQIAGKRSLGEQTGDMLSPENIKSVINASASEAAGGTMGAAANVPINVLQAAQQQAAVKAEDNAYKDAYANILEDKGFSFAAKDREERNKVKQEDSLDFVNQALAAASDAPDKQTFRQKLSAFAEANDTEFSNLVDEFKERFSALKGRFTGNKPVDAEVGDEPSQFDALVAKYKSMGMLTQDAERVALQELKETPDGTGTTAGTRESGISTSNQTPIAQGTTAGATGTESGGVGGASGTAGSTGVGNEAQRSALNVPQNLVDLYAKSVAADEANKVSSTPVNKRNATIAAKRLNEAKAAQLGLAYNDYLNEADPEAIRALDDAVTTAYNQRQEAPTETTPVITKGKTGRPKVELTPEQVAAKSESRRQQQSAGRNAIRMAEKAQSILGKEFDPSEFESLDAAQLALDEFNEARRQALEDAYRISTDSSQRHNKAGTIAKQLLAQATPMERESAKNRTEAKDKTKMARSIIAESTTGSADKNYNRFKNASQALNWLIRHGNDFESELAKRLLPFVRKTNIVIVNSLADLPTQSLRDKFDGASGLYYAGNNTIYLDARHGINNTVFLHEALHGATIARINEYIAARDEGREIDLKLGLAVSDLERLMNSAKGHLGIFQRAVEIGRITNPDHIAVIENAAEFDDAGAFDDIKEFLAYGFTHPTLQDFLTLVPGTIVGEPNTVLSPKNGFTRFVQTIRKFFDMGEGYRSAFQDLIVVSDRIMRAPFEEQLAKTSKEDMALAKKMKQKETRVEKSLKKTAVGRTATQMVNGMTALQVLKGEISFDQALNIYFRSGKVASLEALVPFIPTNVLISWTSKKIPQLNSYLTHMDYMGGMTSKLLNSVNQKTKQLLAYQRGSLWHRIKHNPGSLVGYGDPNNEKFDSLVDMMLTATDMQVDPEERLLADALAYDYEINDLKLKASNAAPTSQPSYSGKIKSREGVIRDVYALWNKLNDEGKKMYVMVRDQYVAMFNLYRSLLDERIDMYKVPGTAEDPASPKGKLVSEIKKMYELSKRLSPYFPFNRDGAYWAQIGTGKSRKFFLAESRVKRDKIVENIINQNTKSGVDKRTYEKLIEDGDLDVGDDIHSLRKSTYENSDLLKRMFETIDKAGSLDPEALKDDIYQMYLMTMPERSFRSQFIHRKGVAGYSTDIVRGFVTAGVNSANQLARMKYGPIIMKDIEAARDSLKGNPNKLKLEVFVNEIQKRADLDLNPQKHGKFYEAADSVANKLNQFAFLYYMTSAATFIRNSFGFVQFALPYLVARHDPIKVAAELAKLSFIWNEVGIVKKAEDGTLQWYAPSFGDSLRSRANADEMRAYEVLVDRQIADTTRTYELTERRKTPTDQYNGVWQTGVNFMSAGMHHTERLMRELTYMMSYRLSRQEGKSHDEAVAQAVLDVKDSLGDFSSKARPRVMRNPAGKIAFQFQMFPTHAFALLIGNFRQMLPFIEGNENKKQAAMQFFGVLTTTAILAGTMGLPAVSFVLGTLTQFFREIMRDLSDDEEKKRNPIENRDLIVWYKNVFLPQTFGDTTIAGMKLSELVESGLLNSMTGYDFASGLSLNNLWFHDTKASGSVKQSYLDFLQKLGGASGAMIEGGANDGKPFELFALPAQFMAIIADIEVFPPTRVGYQLYYGKLWSFNGGRYSSIFSVLNKIISFLMALLDKPNGAVPSQTPIQT